MNTEECTEWFTWPQVFGTYKRGAGEFFLSYIMYIFWSTIFATFAVLLVKVFAPYACGSGIPEVRRKKETHQLHSEILFLFQLDKDNLRWIYHSRVFG